MGCVGVGDESGLVPEPTCFAYAVPQHEVTLDGYYIDQYEVTNRRYQACVAEGVCTLPRRVSSVTRNTYYDNPTYADYPVIQIRWAQAVEFCEWEGKRLPTEAEWEKAARGEEDTRNYPWGDDDPTCDHVNGRIWDAEAGNWNRSCVGDTSRVGSYPMGVSPYGVHDMAGNVHEYVNDWFGSDYYCAGPNSDTDGFYDTFCDETDPAYVSPWVNPQGPPSGVDHR